MNIPDDPNNKLITPIHYKRISSPMNNNLFTFNKSNNNSSLFMKSELHNNFSKNLDLFSQHSRLEMAKSNLLNCSFNNQVNNSVHQVHVDQNMHFNKFNFSNNLNSRPYDLFIKNNTINQFNNTSNTNFNIQNYHVLNNNFGNTTNWVHHSTPQPLFKRLSSVREVPNTKKIVRPVNSVSFKSQRIYNTMKKIKRIEKTNISDSEFRKKIKFLCDLFDSDKS